MLSFFGTIILFIVALSAIGLIVAYVLVPLFRGVGWLIGAAFKSVGWLFAHVFEYIGGTVGDLIRLVGSLLTCIVLLPFAPLNVVLGRWSAAGHYAETLKREAKVACSCVYRILLRRPLKLFWLHGILEGLEQRVPEAMAAAPASDKPSRRTGTFDGYEIVGSLPGGGSGAKLYIARPSDDRRRRLAGPNERVVIKSFALSEGSALPQIVRESRALEAARQLGLVLDHGMDDLRFFYVMPYHAGDHLGIVTRQLHAESDGRGLHERGQRLVMGYMGDLLGTLNRYHAGGLWHKDVKPENIIIHDGQAHLVDLGLVTPLRSAMTLTTHGTEYFRDPELVRQALRGVKVHQIDGAKFDVYAVGAVTYYMIENTFPAHGGLSRFTKKSPEALRWVIKRAMADYNQRYETSDAMLADLRAVLAAPDPFVVRPVDLPSMRGGSQPETPAA
ncbi:MAG: serine/threonine protein kinase, partial [Planctomycetota bacterium]